MKNQGQSTVEYILMTALATFFVMALFSQMNPKFKIMIDEFKSQATHALSTGKLLTHASRGPSIHLASDGAGSSDGSQVGGEGSTGRDTNATNAARSSFGSQVQEQTPSKTVEAGSIGQSGSASEEDQPSSSPDQIASSQAQMQSGGEGGADSQGSAVEGQAMTNPVVQGEDAGGHKTQRSDSNKSSGEGSRPESKKDEKVKEDKEDLAKGRGLAFREGQEEEALGGQRVNWIRILMIALIIFVAVYLGFQIVQGVKTSKK